MDRRPLSALCPPFVRYKFVWCNRCGFGPEESVNIDQFNSALEKVHKNLFSPKQVTFFMKALDIVQVRVTNK